MKRFDLGRLLATPRAIQVVGDRMAELVTRHAIGDWGDLCDFDKKCNDEATECGERILSAYRIGTTKVYVITEADRGSTTVLLADEY